MAVLASLAWGFAVALALVLPLWLLRGLAGRNWAPPWRLGLATWLVASVAVLLVIVFLYEPS